VANIHPFHFTFALIALTPTWVAFANDAPSYCYSLPLLAEKVNNCSKNKLFAQAAKACLDKMENDIDAQQQILAQAMQLNNSAAASAQGARITNNSTNLVEMKQTIRDLQAAALKARAEIILYSQNFTYPGPMSKKKAAQLRMEKILQQFSCFSDPRDSLAENIKLIDQRIMELRKTEKDAQILEKTGNQYVESLKAGREIKAAGTRAPASTGAPAIDKVKRAPKHGPSSITGTHKIGESDRALQKLEKAKR
jgi:hypothetical protein